MNTPYFDKVSNLFSNFSNMDEGHRQAFFDFLGSQQALQKQFDIETLLAISNLSINKLNDEHLKLFFNTFSSHQQFQLTSFGWRGSWCFVQVLEEVAKFEGINSTLIPKYLRLLDEFGPFETLRGIPAVGLLSTTSNAMYFDRVLEKLDGVPPSKNVVIYLGMEDFFPHPYPSKSFYWTSMKHSSLKMVNIYPHQCHFLILHINI